MNTRTKVMLGLMILVGVAVFGDRGYRQLVEEPSRQREKQIEQLDRQISEAEDEIVNSVRAADQLLAFEACSLPHNEELARARYQDWLLSLVKQAELQQPSVDSGTPVPVAIKQPGSRKTKEAYKRYSFSVRGRGTLEQATELLYRFYQGGHLHKIKSLSLNPAAGGRMLEMALSIEAIGLDRVERENALSTVSLQRLSFPERSDYQVISRRNVFSQEGDALLSQIVLSAVTTDRQGVSEAWFATGGGRSQVLRSGDALAIPAHDARVREIHPQSVLIEIDGDTIAMTLGKSIQECLAVGVSQK